MTNPISPQTITIDHARVIPWPNEETHKHSRGRLAVVAGGALQTGAARLAAKAGQRVGAGWVSLFGFDAACAVMAHHETSILICQRGASVTLADQLAQFDAVVIGPGLGFDPQSYSDVTMLITTYLGALILDAGAFGHIKSSREPLYPALMKRLSPAVLTPHSGEFTALFGAFGADNKIAATLEAAQKNHCFIVHKGALTVLASPDGQVFVSKIAAPFLASAGTGDVLAGMIGGLCAQGLPALDACKAAIWLHVEAGRRLGPGLIAEDVILSLPALLGNVFHVES